MTSASRPRVCQRCLNYEGMRFYLNPRHVPRRVLQSLRVDGEGVCSVCRAYAREHDAAAHEETLGVFLRQLAEGRPAMVLCSGGKDSVATTALVRGLSRGPVVGWLFDNGFIPPHVIEGAHAALDRMGVPLLVDRFEDGEARAFSTLVRAGDPAASAPCEACARQIFDGALREMDAHDISLLVGGSNYWAAWQDHPVPLVRAVTPAGRAVALVHLPYLMGRTRADTLALLDELGFSPARLKGVSSNCRVPAIVQDGVSAAVGHVPELEDLSLEVLVGHLTRAEAIEELYAKAPAQHAQLDHLFAGRVA